MKNIIYLIVLFSVLNVYSQNFNDIGKISLSIVMPENLEDLDESNLSNLETKILEIVNKTGLSGTGYNNNFVIYPKFTIYNSKISKGMQNITFIDCELSLFIKQVDNNMVFSSISKKLNGNGLSKQEAISNSIDSLDSTEDAFSKFIEKGKTRIIQYYESRCADLIVQADGMAKRQSYEEALALLLSIPSEVSCFSKVQSKTIEIYKNYQSYRCGGLLQQAQSDAAQNDFSSSLSSLSQIDPSSKCGPEAKALMGKIEGKIDAANRQQFQATMMVYKDAVQLEKQRISAVRDIAVEYARNQPKPATNNYLILIR
ncbi:MAG: hypothetical protein ACOYBS_08460 [Flavobacterium sp.]